MEILAIIGCVLVSLGLGVVLGRYLLRNLFKQQEIAAQNKAKKILKDAESNAEIVLFLVMIGHIQNCALC